MKKFKVFRYDMNIYLYSVNDSPFLEQLSAALAGMKTQMDVVRLAEGFAFNLSGDRQIRSGDIIILLLAGLSEIEQFLNMKELLADFRLIILLADNSEEMATRAHALMPRFLSTTEQDIDETIRVIERMVRHSMHKDKNGCFDTQPRNGNHNNQGG